MATKELTQVFQDREVADEPNADIEGAWAIEAERRWQEIESGKVKTIPWDEVRESEFSDLT